MLASKNISKEKCGTTPKKVWGNVRDSPKYSPPFVSVLDYIYKVKNSF